MSYVFERKRTASFNFYTNELTGDKTTLQGINATLASAQTICDGVSSLMAIGANSPRFENGVRTVKDNVYDE